MYPVILGLHNLVRWVVIIFGLWAVVRAWRGWLGRSTWTPSDERAARLFIGVLDGQFLLGILLYAIFSPLTRRAFHDVRTAMRDAPVRYFFLEHVAVMVVAIAVAHIGAAKVRRQPSDIAKFQTAAIWLGIALAAIIGFVPWARPLFPGL
jgi:hypothetical protein